MAAHSLYFTCLCRANPNVLRSHSEGRSPSPLPSSFLGPSLALSPLSLSSSDDCEALQPPPLPSRRPLLHSPPLHASLPSNAPQNYVARRRRLRRSPLETSPKTGSSSTSDSSQFRSRTAPPSCSEHSDVRTEVKGSESMEPHLSSVEQTEKSNGSAGDGSMQSGSPGKEGTAWDPLGVEPVMISSVKKQKKNALSSLDAYFDKLNASKGVQVPVDSSATRPSSSSESALSSSDSLKEGASSSGNSSSEVSSEAEGAVPLPKAVKALKSLDAYFDKLHPPAPAAEKEEQPPPVEPPVVLLPDPQGEWQRTLQDIKKRNEEEYNKLPPELKTPEMRKMWDKIGSWVEEAEKGGANAKDGSGPPRPKPTYEFEFIAEGQSLFERWEEQQKIISAPWVINLMLALNVAVYILELGSPELVPDNIMTSLPSLYMAKVNSLIAEGEWWRLITPTFLHSGFLHLLISCFTLAQLGPRVEIAFGPLGFLGAFLVGGAFGNLLSFEATEGITVGGTGPIYALAGAWIVYLLKNREALGKEWADGEAWKVALLAGLNLALGSPPPIDDWTHLGATIGGAFYALLAAPSIRVASSFGKPPSIKSTTAAGGGGGGEGEGEGETWLVSLGPGGKQQLWIYALCLGVLVACYQGGVAAANGGALPLWMGAGSPDLFI